MKNILVNFGTLKGGGGQNVGLNFLSALYGGVTASSRYNFIFLVARGSLIQDFLQKNGKYPYFVVPDNPLRRMYFEKFHSGRILRKYKIDIIYSYFGYGFFPKSTPQVCGAADSNLFFPQINFWAGYKGLSLWKHKLTDRFRIYGLKHADGIVFENPLLEQRCAELFQLKGITTTIQPSISLNYPSEQCHLPTTAQCQKKGLFLCGWQRNKQVMLIPEIAYWLKFYNVDFHFILTAPYDDSEMCREFTAKCADLDVADRVTILGPVRKEMLKDLYLQVDMVFLLSKLESFSNNIIESWAFGRALIVADEPWARALCHNAAVYVDRDRAETVALRIKDLLTDKEFYDRIVANGKEELSGYHSVEERTIEELNFLSQIYARN